MPVVPISPFGFGYGGFGISPLSFIPINLNVLVLGGIAYGLYTVIKNRAGGSDFSESADESSLGSGSTVCKIQIALDSNWNDGNIMQTLANIAEQNGQMSSRNDISRLLADASLALLRRQNDWNAAAFEGEKFNMFNNKETEAFYQRMVVKERSKFEVETTPEATMKGTVRRDIVVPTQAVVSIVVAMRGSSNAYSKSPRSLSEIRNCLQNLAVDAATDDGENVMAVEVMWTPSEPGVVITDNDLIEDYPELIKL